MLDPSATVDGFNYTATANNPDLDPFRASTWDAAIEWYFAKESVLGFAGFVRSIDALPIITTEAGTFAELNLPDSAITADSPASFAPEGTCGYPEGCWEITRPAMGDGATLLGLEVAFQAPFDAFFASLPTVLRDMGIIANYTYTSSQTEYVFLGETINERLLGISDHAYNSTLYYDDSAFGIRLSLAGRTQYLQGGPNRYGNLWQYVETSTRLDGAASYAVKDYVKVTLDVLNLTNTPFDSKIDIDAGRRLTYRLTGRTFLLGARYML
jgi:TonB-dependent receptor